MEMEEAVNFLPEDWPSNPDDFMDLFQFDTNLLFNEAGGSTGSCGGVQDGMNDITSSLINNLHNGFNYGAELEGDGSAGSPVMLGDGGSAEQAMSPLSSLSSDQEFHGFPNSSGASMDGSSYEDDFVGGSSGATDVRSAKVKIELDEAMKEFAVFERNVEQQQLEQQQLALSSSASDSGLSSDNLDFDHTTDYEALSPALSSPGPSISERGGQNSPPRYIKQVTPQVVQKPQIIVQPQSHTLTVPMTTTSLITKNGKVYQAVKTVVAGGQHIKKPPSKLVVEKTQSEADNCSLLLNKDQVQPTHLTNTKELKIYRVAPAKNGQTVSIANGNVGPKKLTLQLKNGTTSTVCTKTNGTVFLNNKNVVLTSAPANASSGVRKIIRVQQQQQQNGRSILVPVSIQDLRTIKIVNPANLKAKPANIKLAAANLLQQSKQGLIQKNVVLKKEQLMVDDSDTPQNSDSESFIFEDIMQQSNSVIEQVERQHNHQKQQQRHVMSDSDDGEMDLDDDTNADDGGSVTGSMNKVGAGGYQKLILTAEEKRLLAKEGISLPTSYPLTKHEERELKRIRRKIRNKISAQDSRKRKKEYVDGLEERVKQCTEENQTLLKRIKILQSQNHDLMSQMKKIQSLLSKGTGKTTQPATCLMVLLLSMALVAVPNLKLGSSHHQQNIQDSIEMAELMQDVANEKLDVQNQAQNRRSLLFDTKEQLGDALVDEDMNLDEMMSFNVIASEHDYSSEEEPKSKKAKMVSLVEYDVDDDVWNGSSKTRIKQENGEHPIEVFAKRSVKFHDEFERKMVGSYSGFNIKTEQSEVIVDRELLDMMSQKSTAELYDSFNIDRVGSVTAKDGTIDLLGAAGTPGGVAAGSVEEVGRKLNASQQIQQQNSKRKLLL